MKKKSARIRLIDTTFRDANQSLLSGVLTADEDRADRGADGRHRLHRA